MTLSDFRQLGEKLDPSYFELGARTGPGVCVQGITEHQNVRGGKLELYGSPATLLMLSICLFPHTSSNNFQRGDI